MSTTTSKIIVKYPIALDWKIPKDPLQKAKNSNNNMVSKTIVADAGNISYYLGIFPNGYGANNGKAFLYLKFILKNNIKKVGANYTISIASANYSSKKAVTFTSNEYYFGDVVCGADEVFDTEKRYIVDGEMSVKLDGHFEVETAQPNGEFKIGDYGSTLCVNLWNDDYKDFTILAGGQEIKVHKCILSACSSVFAAMFRSGMKETQENKVVIPDFAFNVVEAAIKLCYHRSLLEDCELEEKMLIFQFFDKYNIQPLKDDLENFFISVITEVNVCRLANFSITTNAPKLHIKCAEFLRSCLKTKPVGDLDILNAEFALDVFKSAFRSVSD